MRGGKFGACALSLLILSGCVSVQAKSISSEPASEAPQSSVSASARSVDASQSAKPEPGAPSVPVENRPSAPFVPREVSINVSGDLLWHNTLFSTAEVDAEAKGGSGMDFAPQLAGLSPFISRADIAVCHAEVPMAPEGGPYTGDPMFDAPAETSTAIGQTGWDACTTASNHTMDKGWDGLVRTIDVFEAAGVVPIGTHRTEQESATPQVLTTRDGVKVAFVSQAYGLNGIPKAKGKEWSVSLIDAGVAIAKAKAAKEAGAEIVAVHIHAGDEYGHEPNAQQVAFAEAVTASEYVDFVFGQHAHVVQPIDKVNAKWVLYGCGNLMAQSGQAKPYTYDGYVAELSFVEQEDGSFTSTGVRWAPTFITKHGRGNPARVLLIPYALAQGVWDADALEQSAERTRRIVAGRNPEGLVELTSIS